MKEGNHEITLMFFSLEVTFLTVKIKVHFRRFTPQLRILLKICKNIYIHIGQTLADSKIKAIFRDHEMCSIKTVCVSRQDEKLQIL